MAVKVNLIFVTKFYLVRLFKRSGKLAIGTETLITGTDWMKISLFGAAASALFGAVSFKFFKRRINDHDEYDLVV